MIWRIFRPRPRDRSIDELYGVIVAQARSPGFYSRYGVPDSVDGRFDLIVLHLVLVIERLGGEGAAAGRGIGQELFDAFCRDLDDNLREMGVGDFAVPKRMRRFGEAFYGRQTAYLAAFATADSPELEKALQRNIFPGADDMRGAARLADYARAARRQLAAQGDSALLAGQVSFPQPDSIAEAIIHA
jgi:cytochrome b pre-mRNA-processing protein 3